jgi:hypothetical protein
MLHRKTTPRVKDGRVQQKNRAATTAPDGYTLASSLQIIRHAPGPGRVHVVDEHDVRRFVGLLPDWPALGAGIHAIVLDRGRDGYDACYRHDGVIVICSWPEALTEEYILDHFEEHREVFDRIGVPYDVVSEPAADGTEAPRYARCWFEPHTARDFLLMHVLLHELGHHEDRRTLRRGGQNRGEAFAEAWALARERELWPRYRAAFGPGATGGKRR